MLLLVDLPNSPFFRQRNDITPGITSPGTAIRLGLILLFPIKGQAASHYVFPAPAAFFRPSSSAAKERTGEAMSQR